MGCSGSKHGGGVAELGSGKKSVGLSVTEIQQRLDHPEESQTFVHDKSSIRYAWVSQRGYYPDSPNKDNQDTYKCIEAFGKSRSGMMSSFFGVFDGHGRDGHYCARFARDVLHAEISKRLEKLSSLPDTTNVAKYHQEVKHSLELAHLATNSLMKSDRRFDSDLSGTTAISVLLMDGHIFVSNVGDSRAIVVSENADGNMVAKPLSSDQTPYRADERARVKRYGARVLSMEQIEGSEPHHENWGDITLGDEIDEGGDPPRIWHPRENYPGTAFSRSLGDAVAETLGVVANPEILEREINEMDRHIIIASDGVFEFLTNQMVADIALQHKDPLAACQSIVESAYNMWLQYEVRTDDITIIMMSLADGTAVTGRMSRSSSISKEDQPPVQDSRPVRRAVSKEKKKNMIQTKSEEADDGVGENDIAALLVPKSQEDEEAIAGAIKSNFLFQHLNVAQRQAVIGVMQPVEVTTGEWVITQDDHGDRFYVVDSGRYEVRVRPPGKVDSTGGFVVHVYESGNGQHPGFGELSLMYGKPRAASVIALENGKLWALDRRVFKGVVMRSMDVRKDAIRTLRLVPLLKVLNLQQLQRLADAMNEETFAAESTILTRGEESDTFYLIVSGEVQLVDQNGDKTGVILRANDFMGEHHLLAVGPSTVTATAKTAVRVRVMSRDKLEELLGSSMQGFLDAEKERLATLSKAVVEAPEEFADIELLAVVNADSVSHTLLGSFGFKVGGSGASPGESSAGQHQTRSDSQQQPNVTIRSFTLSDVDASKLSGSVLTTIDAGRVISSNSSSCAFVPRLLRVYREPNALHLLFNAACVTDLYSLVHQPVPAAADPSGASSGGGAAAAAASPAAPTSPLPPPPSILAETDIVYVTACIVSALETLHKLGIVYRGVQPEGLFITTTGSVVLMDYRVCKVGGVGARSFTICGATEYLAPEQISQRGHGAPVDLWALGVLLYELAIGSTPFSAPSEVATYSKISSFGSTSFPTLVYPEPPLPPAPPTGGSPKDRSSSSSSSTSPTPVLPPPSQPAGPGPTTELKSIVNRLLVPAPEARLGASPEKGFDEIKRHSFFRAVAWDAIELMPSPLFLRMAEETADVLIYGLKDRTELAELFAKPFQPTGADWTKVISSSS